MRTRCARLLAVLPMVAAVALACTPLNPLSKYEAGCKAGEKICGDKCVPEDAAHGCASASCDACVTTNATASCAAGACSIGGCADGFADIDGSVATGCESDLSQDAKNCGAVGVICSFPNATPLCQASACVQGTCSDGFADCLSGVDGCETPVDGDVNNCGACGRACTGQTCTGGRCDPTVLATQPGFDLRGVAVDDDNVYWAASGASGAIYVLAKDPAASAVPTVFAAAEANAESIAAGGGCAYWTTATAVRKRATASDNGGCKAAAEDVATMLVDPQGLALTADDVLWADYAPGGGQIYEIPRLPLTASAPIAIASDLPFVNGPLGVVGTVASGVKSVLWVNGGDLDASCAGTTFDGAVETKVGTSATVSESASTLGRASAVVADRGNAFVAVACGPAGAGGQILSFAFVSDGGSGGSWEQTITAVAGDEARPRALAVDDTYVYWANGGVGEADGQIRRAPRAGGPVVTMADGQPSPYALAVDAAAVFWTAGDGKVRRLAKVDIP